MKAEVGPKAFRVVWRKRQSKMHKTWDGDGFIVQNSSQLTFLLIYLLNTSDQFYEQIQKIKISKAIIVGSSFFIGAKEVEITEEMNYDCFSKSMEKGPVVLCRLNVQ
jgi:hypothetical protein